MIDVSDVPVDAASLVSVVAPVDSIPVVASSNVFVASLVTVLSLVSVTDVSLVVSSCVRQTSTVTDSTTIQTSSFMLSISHEIIKCAQPGDKRVCHQTALPTNWPHQQMRLACATNVSIHDNIMK